MSRLVIPAASVFEISCGKSNKRTNKIINADKHPIHATAVGVGNK